MATKSRPKPRPVSTINRPEPDPRQQVVRSLNVSSVADLPPIRVSRDEVEAAIIEHINTSETRPMRRRRLLAIFENGRRPALKQNIVDAVLADIEENGDLEELPDGVLAARDWASFLEIVMKYLPAILALFGL